MDAKVSEGALSIYHSAAKIAIVQYFTNYFVRMSEVTAKKACSRPNLVGVQKCPEHCKPPVQSTLSHLSRVMYTHEIQTRSSQHVHSPVQ